MCALRSILSLLVLTGLFIGKSFATSPSIIVNGDPPLDFTIVTSTSFGFGADPSGGGDFGFTNDSGEVWTKLDILVTLPTLQFITCGSVAFVTCTVAITSPIGQTPVSYDITYGPNPLAGINNKENFTINLNDNGIVNEDPNGPGSWGATTHFDAVANAPEPSAIALGTLGLAAVGLLLTRRRVRAKALL